MAVDYFLISALPRLHRLKTGRSYIFGRDETADIQIQDQSISRRHAELRWIPSGAWELRDLESRNGVLVNAKRITQPTVLKDSDTLQVGGQRYRLQFVPPGTDPNLLLQSAPKFSDEETMGPNYRLSEIVSQGAAFIGVVDADKFLDLLQYFHSTGKTGRLDLSGGHALAATWFLKGDIIHAFYGTLQGMDALVDLARRPPKKFAFHAIAPPPEKVTMEGSLQGVLMEVMRILDEDRRS
jgi:hypothetical protein